MYFLNSADGRIVFAFWLGVAVVVMALLLMVVIVGMRRAMQRKERRHERAASQWKRLMVEAVEGGAVQVPRLPRAELSGFVDAWNHVNTSLPGRSHPSMLRIAHAVGLEAQLVRCLGHGSFESRVSALIAFGFLRSRTHFDRIASYLDDRSPLVSLCAARALMQIQPERAVDLFVPHIVSRPDWSPSGVADVLREAGPEVVSRGLGDAALQANADIAPRLVRFLAEVSPREATPVITRILRTSEDEHLVSTCLQVLDDPAHLDMVRPLLDRERWHVRMHAASALGRLGDASDEARLVPLLADQQWWVRYRAAQALARLSAVGVAGLERIRALQTDQFAMDIVDHVLAENRMGVHR